MEDKVNTSPVLMSQLIATINQAPDRGYQFTRDHQMIISAMQTRYGPAFYEWLLSKSPAGCGNLVNIDLSEFQEIVADNRGKTPADSTLRKTIKELTGQGVLHVASRLSKGKYLVEVFHPWQRGAAQKATG